MATTFESYTVNASVGTSNSLVLTKPDSSLVTWGDTLFILVGNDDATATDQFDEWTGWTKQFEFGNPLPDAHIALFTRRADGTEALTETINSTNTHDLWGVYGRLTDAGDEFTAILQGADSQQTNAASHTLAAVDPNRDSITFFAMAFDGADATFTVTTPWVEETTIRSGTSGTTSSGIFGYLDTSDGVAPGATVIDSSVTDGSIGLQFSFRPFTFFEKALAVAIELDILIGPSGELWDAATEEGSLLTIITQAQRNTGFDPFTPVNTAVRTYVWFTLTTYLGTAGSSPTIKESNATPGQVNVASADTVIRITADVEEEAPIL